MRRPILRWGLLLAFLSILAGCYVLRPSSGGGQTALKAERAVDPSDIALPAGYRIEAVATELTFPTGVAFDDKGNAYVVESGYSYGEVWTTPRLLRIGKDGKQNVIAEGGKNGPWTGVFQHQGAFYVAEGGALEGGRILRITPEGAITALVEGLPTKGDHHTNGPVIGPDGWLYFGQGTATNSGIVGSDNRKFGWLKRYQDFHDTPCQDIVLNGRNYKTKNYLDEAKPEVETGAFSPYGTRTEPGQVVRGQVPCSGAVLRIRPEALKSTPELVAWGFRNPFGLAFSPEGRLFVTDNMYDERGSRPVYGAGDLLWEVRPGVWYGWPDLHGGILLNSGDRYKPQGKDTPDLVLQKFPGPVAKPVAIFDVHASADGFDFSRSADFGYQGQAFVALLGDEAPTTGKVLGPVGFKIVRVDMADGTIHEFAVNRGKTNGPASRLGKGGLERPVAARFSPDGSALYVADFGVLLHDKDGAKPQVKTGVLWKITRTGPDRK